MTLRGNGRNARKQSVQTQCVKTRQALFAQLALAPDRLTLGATVERIEQRLAEAHRLAKRRWPVAQPESLAIADAALATACLDKRPGAWETLANENELTLIAAAMWLLDEEQAIITVRRLLAELRKASGKGGSAMGLRLYRGDRPLREWLLERLTGRIAVGVLASGAKAHRRNIRAISTLRSARATAKQLRRTALNGAASDGQTPDVYTFGPESSIPAPPAAHAPAAGSVASPERQRRQSV